jgi:predicted enzyme related to lactoylglutathione lyase
MPVEVASIVLFSSQATAVAEFYAAVGATLIDEQHDDGPVHFAVELGDVHFAIYQADGNTKVASHRQPGESFLGFYVDSLDAVIGAMSTLGNQPTTEHEQMPWGCRILFEDPDGRTVEINDREHCR